MEPVSNPTTARSIGPVTTAAGGGAALALVLCWLVQIIAHVNVPVEVQGALSVVLVILAGWAVPPARQIAANLSADVSGSDGKHTAP